MIRLPNLLAKVKHDILLSFFPPKIWDKLGKDVSVCVAFCSMYRRCDRRFFFLLVFSLLNGGNSF